MTEEFLGRGWRFPVGVNQRGSIALSAGAEDVQEAIQIILGTVPGERVMRPEFGCDLQGLVFSSNDPSTRGLIDFNVREALARWEPRIEVMDVLIHDAEESRGSNCLLIEVNYKICSTNERHNLVFPFYRMGEER